MEAQRSRTVIAASGPAGGRPAVVYRQAGDRAVLVEYGEPELDLRMNFLVIRMLDSLTRTPPPGVVDAAPGLRSLLVRFDPARVHRTALVDRLQALHEQQPELTSLTLPSRRVVLPLAFDERATRQAVARYTTTIRRDAPNTRGDNNIDYIVAQNGLPDREAFYRTVLATEWWTALTGFAPGLPFLFPLYAPTTLAVPKYNPTRAWTPEGAVGMGGPCVAIYPVESSGSYQLFGRTLPIYDLLGRNRAFAHEPFLLRAGDRVRFVRVDEAELRELRRRAVADRYTYQVSDAPLAVADYVAELGRRGDQGGATAVRQWTETEVP